MCVWDRPGGLLQASGNGRVWSGALRDFSPPKAGVLSGSDGAGTELLPELLAVAEPQPLSLAALAELMLMNLSDWF